MAADLGLPSASSQTQHLTGKAVVVELLGTLDQAHDGDQVGGVDKLAPSIQALPELQVQAWQHAEGVELDANPLSLHAVALQHVLDRRRSGIALGILPDPHVTAERREVDAGQVGGAGHVGELPANPDEHGMEDYEAVGVQTAEPVLILYPGQD